MTPRVRETMILQTKCGIRKGAFDFSKAHILEAVDGSLQRLRMEYIDVLLLHRSDALVEPREVAETFIILHDLRMQPIVGTTNSGRLKDICKASDVWLTRQEWYEIYLAADNKLL